jgi:zinc/manganese transport system substrate-binding protein
MRSPIKFAVVAALVVCGLTARAEAKLRVVASIEVLADLSRQVGGDRIEVTSLSRGYQDPHFVDAKPSLVLALNRADALVYVGLDLEIGWLPPLVQQSRNARIQRGQPGNIDASTSIKPEDVPNVPSDQLRALGDIHPLGNPHYWIPPKNARAIAARPSRDVACRRPGPRGSDRLNTRSRPTWTRGSRRSRRHRADTSEGSPVRG